MAPVALIGSERLSRVSLPRRSFPAARYSGRGIRFARRWKTAPACADRSACAADGRCRDRVACVRHARPRYAVRWSGRSASGSCIPQRLLKHLGNLLRAAGEHAANAAQAGGDGRLQRFRRSEINQPRRHRLRRHAVFDQRDQKRVEDTRLLVRWHAPPDLQKGHGSKINLAEKIVGEITLLHGDLVRRAPSHADSSALPFFTMPFPQQSLASAVRRTSVGPSGDHEAALIAPELLDRQFRGQADAAMQLQTAIGNPKTHLVAIDS